MYPIPFLLFVFKDAPEHIVGVALRSVGPVLLKVNTVTIEFTPPPWQMVAQG